MAVSLLCLGLTLGLTLGVASSAQAQPVAANSTPRGLPDFLPPPNDLAKTAQPQFPEIQQTAAQIGRGKEDDIDFQINVDPPEPKRLFERNSEAGMKERLRQESRQKLGGPRILFPEESPLSREPYTPRHFPRLVEVVEPCFVVHGRLYFEQPNFERHGWDIGVLQPAVCLATFYKDILFYPYHYWTRPGQRYDTSAGKCLPGDPTPLYLYPPEWSLTGLVGEAGTIIGAAFMIP